MSDTTSRDSRQENRSLDDSSLAERILNRYGHAIRSGLELQTNEEPKVQLESSQGLSPSAPRRRRYRLRGEVARGGMGAILKVWDEDLNRNLAMKVILGDESTQAKDVSLQLLQRFLDEAQITGQLDHPGVLPVHELGMDVEGELYFTMPLVHGRDLKAIIDLIHQEKEGWTRHRALDVIMKVCETLAYAHSKGVVHRDLKPANIMVGRYGEVFVMDWGLAKVQGVPDARDLRWKEDLTQTITRITTGRLTAGEGPDAPLLTMDGTVMGTPIYISPEQARGELDRLGPLSDIYSVGALLYHILTGRMPFVEPNSSPNPLAILALVMQGKPEPIQAIDRSVPSELVAICEKAMARAPAKRYQSMDEMAEDLHSFLEQRVVKAYQTGALAELHKWILRNKALATSCAAAVLALILGLAASLVFHARAKKSAALALQSAAAARANLREILDLSAERRLADLEERADGLWPPLPEQAQAMRTWLADAEKMRSALVKARAREEALRAEAHRGADGAYHFESDAEQEAIEKRWRHEMLMRLVHQLQLFIAGPEIAAGSLGIYGPSLPEVERRLALAEEIGRHDAKDAWRDARARIASNPRYRSLAFSPQPGLTPLGPNPVTGLEEFWHMASGKRPAADPSFPATSNRWKITRASGIVLVLLPGGSFTMGAREREDDDPQYRASLHPKEKPAHIVNLDPFFLSKYELTQAQWLRMRGENPSHFFPGHKDHEIDWRHPVENVSWKQAHELLGRYGLRLPTEAQWEYGCRAGTNTIWYTGDDPASLAGHANVYDSTLIGTAFFNPEYAVQREIHDGYVRHAPVGSFKANPFGLHDMIGNVGEWCLDQWINYSQPVRPGDGLRAQGKVPEPMIIRGGSFIETAYSMRCATRSRMPPLNKHDNIGLRAAAAIHR